MSQKGAQRPFIGPRLPSGPSRTAGQVNQIDVDSVNADQSNPKKKKKNLSLLLSYSLEGHPKSIPIAIAVDRAKQVKFGLEP